MENYNKELLKTLKEQHKNYKNMIDWCCDDYILNNRLIDELSKKDFYFMPYGSDFEDEEGEYFDIYQYFIIDKQGAKRLAKYTKELVLYNDDLDLYLLCVTHYGTPWGGVPANWKDLDQESDDE